MIEVVWGFAFMGNKHMKSVYNEFDIFDRNLNRFKDIRILKK